MAMESFVNGFFDIVMPAMHSVDAVGAPLLQPLHALDSQINRVAKIIHQDPTISKSLLCCLLAYPLAAIFWHLHERRVRLAFSIVVGLFFGFFCFDTTFLMPLATILLSYVMLRVLPAPIVGIATTIVTLCIALIVHLWRVFYCWLEWKIDISGMFMVLVLRLSSVALDHSMAVARAKRVQGKDTGSVAVPADPAESLPSLLEYVAFCMFFPSMVSGPLTRLDSFLKLIDERHMSDVPAGQHVRIPVLTALNRLVYGLACLGLAIMYPASATSFALRDPTVPFYTQYNIVQRYLWILMCMLHMRLLYYAAWKTANGAVIMSGLGYSGWRKPLSPARAHPHNPVTRKLSELVQCVFPDDAPRATWDGCCNVRPFEVEFSPSLRHLLQNWNIQVTQWSHRYIYQKSPAAIATLCTMAFLAVWHGFYACYYFIYATIFITVIAGRVVHRRIRPLFKPRGSGRSSAREGIVPAKEAEPPLAVLAPVYDVVSVFVTNLTFCYISVPLFIMEARMIMQAYHALGYGIHLVCVSLIVLNHMYPEARRMPSPEVNVAGAAGAGRGPFQRAHSG